MLDTTLRSADELVHVAVYEVVTTSRLMGEATGCQLSFPGALPQTQRSTQTIRHTAPGSALEVL